MRPRSNRWPRRSVKSGQDFLGGEWEIFFFPSFLGFLLISHQLARGEKKTKRRDNGRDLGVFGGLMELILFLDADARRRTPYIRGTATRMLAVGYSVLHMTPYLVGSDNQDSFSSFLQRLAGIEAPTAGDVTLSRRGCCSILCLCADASHGYSLITGDTHGKLGKKKNILATWFTLRRDYD